MAPISAHTGNHEVRSVVPSKIEWQPMIVNWFGSMVIAGLGAPLVVWLIIYCIRTRMINSKKEAKAAQPTQPTITGDDTQTWGAVPPSSSSPRKDDSTQKVPKGVDLRRWMGWWTSSSTSREYPRDRRERTKGDYTYTKREHFARFFGWWTCSEETAYSGDSNRAPESEISIQEAADATTTSTGPDREVENFQMYFLISSPQGWRIGRHKKAHTSIDRPSNGLCPKSSEEMSANAKPAAAGFSSRSARATASGADLREHDGSSSSEAGVRGQGKSLSADKQSSDETSDHCTVRKRTVGVAEACDWDNLRGELRRSIQSQMLLPDELISEMPRAQSPKANRMPLETLPAANEILFFERFLKADGLLPRLRKVCSSPNLYSAYKQTSVGDVTSQLIDASLPILLHSTSAPLIPISQPRPVGPLAVKISDWVQPLVKNCINSPSASSVAVEAGDRRKSSPAYSFDRTRRSTLDVVRYHAEADRRTLGDYEAESSVDAEFSNRDGSGTTFSSIPSDKFLEMIVHPKSTKEKSVGLISEESTVLAYGENDNLSVNKCSPELLPGPFVEREPSSILTHIATPGRAQSLGHVGPANDRFATLDLPNRRYSFPSIQKGIETKNELDRKFMFRFADVKEKAKGLDIYPRVHTLPRRKLKIPVTSASGNGRLDIAKMRRSESGKVKTKIKSRKLTPFMTWNDQYSSNHMRRSALPKDWQTLSRLPEAPSPLSENKMPLSYYRDADLWCDETTKANRDDTFPCPGHTHVEMPVGSSNLLHRETMKDIFAKPMATVRLPSSVTPEPSFAMPSIPLSLKVTPNSQHPSSWITREDAGVLHLTPVRVTDKGSPASLDFTGAQLRCGGSPIKRAFTNQSWAEKAKRRESMRRAGRLPEDQHDA